MSGTRETFEPGPNLPIPGALTHELMDAVTVAPVIQMEDCAGTSYDLYTLNNSVRMPQELADWLRFRSHTDDRIGTFHEGDRYRFDNPTLIIKNFLKDRGGRTLYAAVHQEGRYLAGVSWVHELQGDEKDYTLLGTALGYLAIDTDSVERISPIGTAAVREYGKAYSHIGVELILSATENYVSQPDHGGVVSRFSSLDPLAQTLGDGDSGNLHHTVKYRPIGNGERYIILYAAPPEIQPTASPSA